jgi:hypothetical protein
MSGESSNPMNEQTTDLLPHQTYLFNSTCRSSSKALRDVPEEGSTAGASLVMVSCLPSLSLSLILHVLNYFFSLSRRFFRFLTDVLPSQEIGQPRTNFPALLFRVRKNKLQYMHVRIGPRPGHWSPSLVGVNSIMIPVPPATSS